MAIACSRAAGRTSTSTRVALELETVSLGQLKRYQIACYANLYLRNRRFSELVRLVIAQRAVGAELLRSAAARTAVEAAHRLRAHGTTPQSPRPRRLLPHRRHPAMEVADERGHCRPGDEDVVAGQPRSDCRDAEQAHLSAERESIGAARRRGARKRPTGTGAGSR